MAEMIQRFDKHQRLQHIILFISIFILCLTGFPIKYGHMGWAKEVTKLFWGFDNMLIVHLVAAVMMLLSGVYHIVWLIIHFVKNGPKWSMLPTFKDLRDAFHHAKYLIGVRKTPPQYGRYSYLEKFEYFAVIYGIVLMGLSGFILWFPEKAAAIMPRWVIDMFRIAHSNEAIVCLLAVAIGHFFWAHLNPDVFPSSTVWYNGKISKQHLRQEHPLEYEQMTENNEQVETDVHETKFNKNRVLIIVELCIYITVFIILLSLFIPMLLA